MKDELQNEINALRNEVNNNTSSYHFSEKLFELIEYYNPFITNTDIETISKICVDYVAQASVYNKMAFIGKIHNKHINYHYSCNSAFFTPMKVLYKVIQDVMNSVRDE